MAAGLQECNLPAYDNREDCLMDDDDNDDAWEETEQEPVTPAMCLFCGENFGSPATVFIHCVEAHSFDMRTVSTQTNLDCFGYIKFVNYVRGKVK